MAYDPFKPTKVQRISAGLQLVALVIVVLTVAVIVIAGVGLLIGLTGLDVLPTDAIENMVGVAN